MRVMLFSLVTIGFLLQLGCAPSPTHLSPDFGASATMALESQILDPDAHKNLDPVQGIDGPAVNTALEKYRESFKSEDSGPPPSLILSTVSGSGN